MADSSNLLHRGQLRQHGGGSESSAAFASTINKAQAMEQARRSYFSCSCGLMRHEDLPRWIQVIDASTGWVSNHHRPPQPSVTACIASAFQWNTETINIWSHLLAFLATVYFIYDILTNQFFVGTKEYGFTFDELSWLDKAVMMSYALSSLIIFGISTIFHTFICHSHRVADKLRRLDHVAAMNHVACGNYPIIYAALTCSPYRWHYMWAVAISSLIGMIVFYFADVYEPERAWVRGVMALLVALIAQGALVHQAMYVGYDEIWLAIGGPWLFRMIACNLSALLFYTCHFPERFWPGKFDILGHSHQLLHVVTSIATACQAYAMLNAYGYNLHTPCH